MNRPLTMPPEPRKLLRTLFVEDNLELREQIADLLADEGLDLLSCASAEEAMEAYAREAFDLVVTDVSLPRMSGVDLARAILRRTPEAWVVFSSGYAMGADLMRLGPHVRALLKPFELQDLQTLLVEVRAQLSRQANAPGEDQRPRRGP